MELSTREIWTLVHGMLLGALFLLAFAGGAAGLWSLRPGYLTPQGLSERLRRLKIGTLAMTIASWCTVTTGTYIVYIWYRAKIPESPRSLLLADPITAGWHTFGMEWKEHVAWLAPILATTVTYLVFRYQERLLAHQELRRVALILFGLAFVAAAIAGLFGALITKAQPIV